MLFLIPFLFVAVLGQVFSRGVSPTVAVYAVSEDDGRAARQVMDVLEDIKHLDLQILPSREEADRRVGGGQRMAAIVVPAGFSEALTTPQGAKIEIIIDPAREQTAGIVVGQVGAATASMLIDAEVTRGVGNALDSVKDNFDPSGTNIDTGSLRKFLTAALKGVVSSQVQDAMDDPLVRLNVVAAGDAGNIVRPPTILEHLVPGYTFFFAFFLVGMMARVVLDERVSGTFRRLLVSPVSRAAVLLGKIVPYFIIIVVQVSLLMGLCSVVFDVGLGQSPLAFLLMTVAAAAAVVGLGIMVAALVRTEGQAESLPDLLTISMAVVSGAMFPSIRFPFLQYLTPHFWAIQGFQDVITRNLGVGAVLNEAGILLGMAVIFFAVGVSRFRFE
jgi:ABC-2 type transport system permease protein